MTDPPKRIPFYDPWIGQDIPQASTIEPRILLKALKSLDAIRSHAERAPFPDPDRVAQHGERAVLISSFAMIRMMAESAIEWIGAQSGYTVADAT
jgi:hypothetical protein